MSQMHRRVTTYLIAETVFVFAALATLAVFLAHAELSGWFYLFYLPVLLFQGLWLDRIYIVGHEAAHKKLVPENRRLNDLLGQAVLLPLLVPVIIYRKVHYFHHGSNRKDHHTAALDVFVSRYPVTPIRRVYYYLLWYLGVFAGGYFLHSLVSILIFLFLPTRQAQKISPAFSGWTDRDRLTAWQQYASCLAFHAAVWWVLGAQVWLYALFYPLLAFAWIWSLLVYIFHYHTTIGAQTRYNVRALHRHPFFSWLLLNFNEHATHHMKPTIPWYDLPEKRQELPQLFSRNQDVKSFWRAILNQFRGPTIVYDRDENPTPQLFVRWED